jgi:ATP-dependent DNA helicase RecG
VSANHDIWIEQVEGRDVLVMVVPEVRRANKPVHLRDDTDLAYFRRGDADVKCDTDEIRRMLRESQVQAADRDVIDYLDFSDLDADAVRRFRTLCAGSGSRHLRDDPDDRTFLKRIGVWRHDREVNRQGLARGGVLMLGEELAIQEIRPDHVIDFRLEDQPGPGGRYRDRIRWTGHVFGAWEEITPLLIRRLPVPFRLSGTTRIDDPEGEDVVREAFVNLLIHTDYLESSDSRAIVTADGFLFDNPGSSRVPVAMGGLDLPDHFAPSERRNPLLSSLFALINQAELAGSGVRSMRTRWRELGYQSPRFQSSVQEYRFSVFLSLRSMISLRDRDWLESLGGPWTENEEFALLLARDQEGVDNQQLRELAGLHRTDATGVLQGLRDKGIFLQNGYGRWSSYTLVPILDIGGHHEELVSTVGDIGSGHKDTSSGHKEDIWAKLGAIAIPVSQVQRSSPEQLQETVIELCRVMPLTRSELINLLNRSAKTVNRITATLLRDGRLDYEQASITSPHQRYVATDVSNSKESR